MNDCSRDCVSSREDARYVGGEGVHVYRDPVAREFLHLLEAIYIGSLPDRKNHHVSRDDLFGFWVLVEIRSSIDEAAEINSYRAHSGDLTILVGDLLESPAGKTSIPSSSRLTYFPNVGGHLRSSLQAGHSNPGGAQGERQS